MFSKIQTAGLVTALAAGCGAPEAPLVVAPTEYIAVSDNQGNRRVIPIEELAHAGAADAPIQVLAIDRQSNETQWAPLAEVFGQPPASARYIPLTHSDPAELPTQ